MLGIVYKIYSPNANEIYIGSTTQILKYRFQHHIYDYNNWLKNNTLRMSSSRIIFEKFGVENCKITSLAEYEVVDEAHLRAYECKWIGKLNRFCVNKYEPINFLPKHKDMIYYQKNKDDIIEKSKKNYDENKEYILERSKEYREKNKDEIAEKRKERRKKNIDFYRERDKKNYEKYKNKILEKQKQKWFCEICNIEITIRHKSRHINRPTHQKNLKKE